MIFIKSQKKEGASKAQVTLSYVCTVEGKMAQGHRPVGTQGSHAYVFWDRWEDSEAPWEVLAGLEAEAKESKACRR